MNYRMILRVLGMILLIYAELLMLPLIVGLLFGESAMPFLKTLLFAAVPGALLLLPKPTSRSLVARDSFVIVGLGWILITLIGALPFVFSGSIPSYTDALFETASGLSTTGATVLQDFDGMPRGVMFWRCFTHWIGGMGVLVFLMAVLPMSGEHSMHIMRAEVPGPTVGKLVPRLKHTARILYMLYIGMTVLETVALLLAGLSFYDALLHAFATAGTGGFSTLSDSIAGFHSPAVESILAVFMILFGLNFNLYYLLLIGSWRKVLKNEEGRLFLLIILACLLQCGGPHLDHRLRNGGLYPVAGVLQVDPDPPDVLRRLRGLYRRRHQALAPDDPLPLGPRRPEGHEPSAQRLPRPAGGQAGREQHRPRRVPFCDALYGAAAGLLDAPLAGRRRHCDRLHRVPLLPVQHRARHDPGHRPQRQFCLFQRAREAPAQLCHASRPAGVLPDPRSLQCPHVETLIKKGIP